MAPFFVSSVFGARVKPPPWCLNKEALGKYGNVLGDGVVVDMLLHLVEKFRCKFHCSGDHFRFKLVISDLNFVGVEVWCKPGWDTGLHP